MNETPDNDNLLINVELTASERRAGTPALPASNAAPDFSIEDVTSSNGEPGVGYISIRNNSNVTADLSHWRVTGDAFEYVLPAGTIALPNGLVYIAADRQAIRAADNIGDALVVGGIPGRLIPDGEFELTAP